jgi:hypothetical protein
MQPSEELRLVVGRFFDSVREGDELAVSNRISRQPGFQRFGTDPVEWWDDGEQAVLVWLQQMREIGGGFSWRRVSDISAQVEGTVGWASLVAELRLQQAQSRSA